MTKTFICTECGHELPIEFEHEEKQGVCFLDYVSEKDSERIDRAIVESEEMWRQLDSERMLRG